MIDWSKPIETTDGIPATFLKKLDTHDAYSYLVTFRNADGKDALALVMENGVGHLRRFRNKKQEISRFVVLVPDPDSKDGYSCEGYFTSGESVGVYLAHRTWPTGTITRKWTVEV
ncbi:MAG: hypothetical protein IM557_08170 [Chitinophagaceae bacterium]|nr:hypothetical protein [Chitinophagaceae bacterium]